MKTIIEMTRLPDIKRLGDTISRSGVYGYTADQMREYAELVRADEREAIYDQWHSCVMADLENGVKWLNEKAAAEWHKNYPAQSNLFPSWIEARGNT